MREQKHVALGRKAPEDKFLEAFRKFSFSDWNQSVGQVRHLVQGAMQAFEEGHPENVQTMILHAKSVESHLEGYKYPSFVPTVLLKLTEKSDDKLAVIDLALAKIPEEDRENILSNALKTAVSRSVGEEPFFALLCGAGASCDSALSKMQAQGYATDDVDRLKFFQERIEGKTASATAAPQPAAKEVLPAMMDIVQQMQEQMKVITAQVSDLAEEVKSLKSGTPAAAPQKKTAPYPKAF
jgi:hypothetical protein